MATGRSEQELEDLWRRLDFWAESARGARVFSLQHEAEGNVTALLTRGAMAGAHLTRALIAWRTGLVDPTPDLEAAMAASESAAVFIAEHAVGPHRGSFDGIPGAVSAILVDRFESPAIETGIREMDDIGAWKRPKASKAVPWLISGLVGKGVGDGPRIAGELAGTKRAGRWGQSLGLYFALAELERDDTAPAVDLTRQSIAMFRERRRREEFVRPYYGSLDMNDIIIDFLLAAIWHVKRWSPELLPEPERVFVARRSGRMSMSGPSEDRRPPDRVTFRNAD